VGQNVYRLFTGSVFITTIQRLFGKDQAAFRQALLELRECKVTVPLRELLSSRCAIKLPP
jgi:hypothetical protein